MNRTVKNFETYCLFTLPKNEVKTQQDYQCVFILRPNTRAQILFTVISSADKQKIVLFTHFVGFVYFTTSIFYIFFTYLAKRTKILWFGSTIIIFLCILKVNGTQFHP